MNFKIPLAHYINNFLSNYYPMTLEPVTEKSQITPRIGLSQEQRDGVVQILNALLADEYVLYTKTRKYHWNVKGMQFNDLHKFFEAQYEQLDDIIDDVAERVQSLGGDTIATLEEFVQNGRLKEDPRKYPQAAGMISSLLEGHESIIRTLRVDLETCASKHSDMGTNNFLTDLMEKHEKMAWMLRAFLEDRQS